MSFREGFVAADFDCVYLGSFRTDKDGNDIQFLTDRIAYLVRPYTPEMRRRAFRMRGRDSFSYGKSVCVLPSAHFYAKNVLNDDLEVMGEECLETERDEED